jgi:hypothetical protein
MYYLFFLQSIIMNYILNDDGEMEIATSTKHTIIDSSEPKIVTSTEPIVITSSNVPNTSVVVYEVKVNHIN